MALTLGQSSGLAPATLQLSAFLPFSPPAGTDGMTTHAHRPRWAPGSRTPGATPPPPCAPSPVQGEVPVAGGPVQLAAVLQPGQRVHAFQHQLQQVAHLAEDAAGLQPSRHCGQSGATIR